jgi:hypothetical protein
MKSYGEQLRKYAFAFRDKGGGIADQRAFTILSFFWTILSCRKKGVIFFSKI